MAWKAIAASLSSEMTKTSSDMDDLFLSADEYALLLEQRERWISKLLNTYRREWYSDGSLVLMDVSEDWHHKIDQFLKR